MGENMKLAATITKVAMGVCILSLAGGLSGCALTTPTRAEVERKTVEPALSASDLVEEGYLTVAMDASDAPQVLTDAEGKPSGYYADVARALCNKLGLKLKVVSSASAASSVGEGKADIYIGTKSGSASDGIAVTSAVVDNASAIFAKTADGSREVPTISADSLAGKTIAVQDASASQDALTRNGIEATQKTFQNVNQCFEALNAGEVDYVACDATAGAYLSRAYEGAVFAGTISTVSSYGIAYATNYNALATALIDTFDELMDSGVIEAIHTSWYGTTPLSLFDTVLSGVTLHEESEDNTSSEQGEDTESEDGEGQIGEGINSLD